MRQVLKDLKNTLDSYQKICDEFCSKCKERKCETCVHGKQRASIDSRYMELVKLIRGKRQ